MITEHFIFHQVRRHWHLLCMAPWLCRREGANCTVILFRFQYISTTATYTCKNHYCWEQGRAVCNIMLSKMWSIFCRWQTQDRLPSTQRTLFVWLTLSERAPSCFQPVRCSEKKEKAQNREMSPEVDSAQNNRRKKKKKKLVWNRGLHSLPSNF